MSREPSHSRAKVDDQCVSDAVLSLARLLALSAARDADGLAPQQEAKDHGQNSSDKVT